MNCACVVLFSLIPTTDFKIDVQLANQIAPFAVLWFVNLRAEVILTRCKTTIPGIGPFTLQATVNQINIHCALLEGRQCHGARLVVATFSSLLEHMELAFPSLLPGPSALPDWFFFFFVWHFHQSNLGMGAGRHASYRACGVDFGTK